MGLIDTLKGFVTPAPTTGGEVARPQIGASYMRGGRGVAFQRWNPALRESQQDIGDAWDGVAARVTDMIHNSGWISGMIDQSVANTVGTGLRLKAIPDFEALGMDQKWAADWSKRVERRFNNWANNPQECDVRGIQKFGQMQASAFRAWIGTGEILMEHPFRKRPWNQYGTKVRVLPPSRLSRMSDDTRRIVNGVKIDMDGMPVGYMAIKVNEMGMRYEQLIRARDRLGRPRVTHIFDGLPGTHRGISVMAPVLQVARQFDQLADATLVSAIVQTLFAATITGDEPTEETLEGLLTPQEKAAAMQAGVSPLEAYMQLTEGFYDAAGPLNLGMNGRLGFLFPGQQLTFHSSTHKSEDYEKFANFLLREIARCLGMTYESATGDNVGATYSSLQAATTEIFAVTKYRRENVLQPFNQPIYETWLEEDIEQGGTDFPGGIEGFIANRTAATRSEWRGDPRPRADDLKTAKAHETWKRMGVMSDAQICNDLGYDVEDTYQQLAQEMDMRANTYKLPEPALMLPSGGAAEKNKDGSTKEDGASGNSDD